MLEFRYVAQGQRGGRKSGVLAASDSADAFRRLKADGLHPIKIAQARTGEGKAQRLSRRAADLADLLEDLAVLLAGGVSLGSALDMAAESRAGTPIADLALRLKDQVQGGAGLDEAFEAAGDRDALLIAGAVAAGQSSSQLPESLRAAANILRIRVKARDELIAACAYPAFLALFAFGLLIFLFVGVLPSFEPILDMADTEPPWIVSAMLGASQLIRAFGLPVLVALLLAAPAAFFAGGRGMGRRIWDTALIDGVFRRVGRPLIYGSSTAFLGLLLKAGVPAADALRSAAGACPNLPARSRLENAARSVREGESIADALEGAEGFPRALARIARVGEQAGVLGDLLTRGGEVEQARAVKAIGSMTKAAAPILVMLMGGFIGAVMASVFLTINALGSAALQ